MLVPRFGAAERSSRKPLGANEWHREEAAERNPKRTGHPKRRVRRPSITRRGSSFVRTPTRAAESIHIAGRAIEIVRLYKAPAGALANDLKVDLKAHREELIRYLAASEGYGRQFDFALPDIEECREETPALSYLQRRLWFIDQLGQRPVHHTPCLQAHRAVENRSIRAGVADDYRATRYCGLGSSRWKGNRSRGSSGSSSCRS